ncbi:hypothetical protein HDU96_000102 [Phlyctochytrium bullatum]|nr:hypothetical protein HDU96_000102 [Phlyctochytrium bullatum]
METGDEATSSLVIPRSRIRSHVAAVTSGGRGWWRGIWTEASLLPETQDAEPQKILVKHWHPVPSDDTVAKQRERERTAWRRAGPTLLAEVANLKTVGGRGWEGERAAVLATVLGVTEGPSSGTWQLVIELTRFPPHAKRPPNLYGTLQATYVHRQHPPHHSTRLRLALDVARALVHLHEHDPPMVAGNLDSTRVWLATTDEEDEYMTRWRGTALRPPNTLRAMVADFGMVGMEREMGGDVGEVWEDVWKAPEMKNGAGVECTPSGDIYSFGVIFTELVTWFGPFGRWFPEQAIYFSHTGMVISPSSWPDPAVTPDDPPPPGLMNVPGPFGRSPESQLPGPPCKFGKFKKDPNHAHRGMDMPGGVTELMKLMLATDPNARPTAREAVAILQDLLKYPMWTWCPCDEVAAGDGGEATHSAGEEVVNDSQEEDDSEPMDDGSMDTDDDHLDVPISPPPVSPATSVASANAFETVKHELERGFQAGATEPQIWRSSSGRTATHVVRGHAAEWTVTVERDGGEWLAGGAGREEDEEPRGRQMDAARGGGGSGGRTATREEGREEVRDIDEDLDLDLDPVV